jgi:F-type H+-transporting ATPase subunit delta
MSSASRIARRYARGLFNLEGGDLAKAKTHLEMLAPLKELFAQQDAGKILRSPVMPLDLKKELVEYGMKQTQADATVTSLVNTVLEGGRVEVLPDVIDAFSDLIDAAEGKARATLVSAVPLPEGDVQAVGQTLGKLLKKSIDIAPAVDPAILGGFVVQVGNYRIDMSLKSKLEALSQSAAQDTLR